jgi:purine nucleosidase
MSGAETRLNGVMASRKLIIDCDPGLDDAVALLLAHGNPAVELIAVTTVAGNRSLPQVTANALGVAQLLGIEAPVAAGADRPLLQAAEFGDMHGDTGLDGVTLPEASIRLDARHAVELIIELVMSHEPGEITLVPMGPLTNIALAARREPRIVDRVREVVLMGGGAWTGNMSAVAEFNIFFDPEAADVVFSAGWPITMIGLDVTHLALATSEVRERFAAAAGPRARLVSEALTSIARSYQDYGFPDPPIHDPVAVAAVIAPQLFTFERVPIRIELAGTHTRGMTVVDRRPWVASELPTRFASALDAEGFWGLVADAANVG